MGPLDLLFTGCAFWLSRRPCLKQPPRFCISRASEQHARGGNPDPNVELRPFQHVGFRRGG